MLEQATGGAAVVLLAMVMFNGRPTSRMVLLPVSQERPDRHGSEKSTPLLFELTSIPKS